MPATTAPTATLAELKTLGFSNEVAEQPRRLVVSVSGRDGTGKSHFLFTAPEPVFLFNIDIGTEGVLEKFQVSGRDIYVYDVRVPKGASQTVYQTMWGEVKERVAKVYRYNEGTLGMDTATEGYELARLAHLGKLTQVLPHHYVEVKSEWRELMRLAYDSRMSTILVQKVKPIYINNNRTKDYEIAGFDETPYMVQLALTTFRGQDAEGNVQFGYTVDKCRRRASLMGQEFRTVLPITDEADLRVDPVVNFDFLLGLVHD
ncbi:hypothetical protein LCGC14_0510160 [marine sediment metagenome]|uniref:Uncharacterized protein n=1 Tax=marine sediment metagenome TaxID=412755 RepID=A0A0F9S1I2_9ZZZZ